MDCSEPVDDYCDVFQPTDLEIPETTPPTTGNDLNHDRFFIMFEVETTFPVLNNDDDSDGDENLEQLVEVESKKTFTFWAPCPRFEHHNLTKERISGMLTSAGVALHKQEFMIDNISGRADEIANAARNRASRVLPILVFISVVACSCYPRNS